MHIKQGFKKVVLYGRGLCTEWRSLVYCMAVREACFCMADVPFCMAEAHGGGGFPPLASWVDVFYQRQLYMVYENNVFKKKSYKTLIYRRFFTAPVIKLFRFTQLYDYFSNMFDLKIKRLNESLGRRIIYYYTRSFYVTLWFLNRFSQTNMNPNSYTDWPYCST